jgi:glycosyltransferase involved in cell wall biosynthesis
MKPVEAPARPIVMVSANAAWNLNYRKALLKAVQDAGFAIVAMVPFDEDVSKLTDAGIEVHSIPFDPHGTSPIAELRLLWRYITLMRRFRPIAFLGFTPKPNIYGSFAAGLVSAAVINNITGLGPVFMKGGVLRWIVGSLYKITLRRSKRVFFQNRESLQLFLALKLIREDQAELIPGSGVNLVHFSPSAESKGTRSGDGFTFLLASRLIWEKGIGEYCEAARWFRQNRPGVRFQLIGPIPPETNKSAIPKAQIEQWERECGLEYLGSIDDVRPYVSAADCIVLPTVYPEGVPRILIEAAAMAKPAITTDTAGCRDIVVHKETGFLCEPESAQSLIDAMIAMVDQSGEERREMGTRARKKAERQFDEAHVVNAYLRVLNEVVEERRAGAPIAK